jgi:uncharacterized linocin/CFP29 family protein
MLFLRREQAPVSEAAWARIDAEARRTLRLRMGARKFFDVLGPKGWADACVNLGRKAETTGFDPGVDAATRLVQPLLELRVPFTLSRADLDDVDRGCPNPDLDPVIDAAKSLARAEGRVLFHGHADSGVVGMADGGTHDPLPLPEDPEGIPGAAAAAVNLLRDEGIEGPYGIALGSRPYTGLVQAPASGGYPALDRLRNVLSGPVVWAPSLEGAVVLSMRGGDFELHVGQDASIGFHSHTPEDVHFFLVETFTMLNLTPEAAIGLQYGG